jgi:hypothetical protein
MDKPLIFPIGWPKYKPSDNDEIENYYQKALKRYGKKLEQKIMDAEDAEFEIIEPKQLPDAEQGENSPS